jgi:hypothetical protein
MNQPEEMSVHQKALDNDILSKMLAGDTTGMQDVTRKYLTDFIQALDSEMDKFIAELKHRIISQQGPQRGVWDRMKGWWSNVTRGRYNQSNPEYWRNRLGDDLGGVAQEGTLSMGLKEFHVLKRLATELEDSLNALNEDMSGVPLPKGSENLRVMSIIDNWANRFKQAVRQLAKDRFSIDLQNPEIEARPEQPQGPERPQGPRSSSQDSIVPEVKPDEDQAPEDQAPEDQAPEDQAPEDQVTHPDDHQSPELGNQTAGPSGSSEPEETEENPTGGPYNPGEAEDGAGTEEIGDMELSKKQIEIMRLKAQADWKNMTSEERDEYDQRGGGIWKAAGQKKFNISSSTHTYKAGIHTLPFFLTKSDPRYWILLGLPTRHYFDAMARNGQIDGISYVKKESGMKVYSPAPTLDGNQTAIDNRIAQIKGRVEDAFSATSSSRSAGWETRRHKKDEEPPVQTTLSEPVDDNKGGNEPPSDQLGGNEPPSDQVGGNEPPSDQVGGNEPPSDQVGGNEDDSPEDSTGQVTEPSDSSEGMSEEDKAEVEDAISKLDPEKHKELIDAARQMMKSGMFSKSDILDSLPDEESGEFSDDGFFDNYKALGKVLREMNLSERKEHLKGLLRKENKRILPDKRKMRVMSWEEKVQYLREQINS